MKTSFSATGFQSPCAEFSEKSLSLDERYRLGSPSIFIVQITGVCEALGIKSGDKLIIDRSLKPREGEWTLVVIDNNFELRNFSNKMFLGQDPESGDFVWGVVTTIFREMRVP